MILLVKGDLQYSIFMKKGKQLKYVRKEITHTPGNLHMIPSGVLNCLAKFTSRKPSIHSEGVEKNLPQPRERSQQGKPRTF